SGSDDEVTRTPAPRSGVEFFPTGPSGPAINGDSVNGRMRPPAVAGRPDPLSGPPVRPGKSGKLGGTGRPGCGCVTRSGFVVYIWKIHLPVPPGPPGRTGECPA